MSIAQPDAPQGPRGSDTGRALNDPLSGTARPVGVVLIAVALVLEALALLAAAAFYVYGLLTSTPVSYGGAIFTLVLLLLLAVWLLAVGHFLFRGYRWPRAAALAWQLFMLVVAVPTLTGGYILYGLALLIPPVVALVLLFTGGVITYVSKTSKPPAVL